MTVVVLFDIDGTILLAHGAGRRAVHRAMRDVFGVSGPESHPFDGKTDPQIVRELGTLAGLTEEMIVERMTPALDRYYDYLEADITGTPHAVELLPGVHDLLDALEARDDMMLGLLTGNIESGASLKLRAVNIAPERFVVRHSSFNPKSSIGHSCSYRSKWVGPNSSTGSFSCFAMCLKSSAHPSRTFFTRRSTTSSFRTMSSTSSPRFASSMTVFGSLTPLEFPICTSLARTLPLRDPDVIT